MKKIIILSVVGAIAVGALAVTLLSKPAEEPLTNSGPETVSIVNNDKKETEESKEIVVEEEKIMVSNIASKEEIKTSTDTSTPSTNKQSNTESKGTESKSTDNKGTNKPTTGGTNTDNKNTDKKDEGSTSGGTQSESTGGFSTHTNEQGFVDDPNASNYGSHIESGNNDHIFSQSYENDNGQSCYFEDDVDNIPDWVDSGDIYYGEIDLN